MPVEAEAGDDDRVELAGQEVGQVERADLLVLHRGVGRGAGVELEAVLAADPLDPLAREIGVERAGRPAVGVGDEDPHVRPEPLANHLDLGGDAVGDPLGSHVQPGVDALDPDARDPRGQGQQLPCQGAATDDDESGRDRLRPHWRGARRSAGARSRRQPRRRGSRRRHRPPRRIPR